MDLDEVWRTIDTERAGLADLLEDLTSAEWATPSLCDAAAGWWRGLTRRSTVRYGNCFRSSNALCWT